MSERGAPVYKSWIYRLSPAVLLARAAFALGAFKRWLSEVVRPGNIEQAERTWQVEVNNFNLVAKLTPKLGKGLGRIVDAPDRRDLLFRKPEIQMLDPRIGVPIPARAPIPSSFDAFHGLSLPVYDQGALGSCTANAGVLYRRFLAQRFAKYSAPDEDLSRLFLYYQERKLPWNSDTATDRGACIRDVCYALAHTGVCPAGDDPYLPGEFANPLVNDTERDLQAAAAYRIGAYHRIADVQAARECIASGYAVLLGMAVYSSFEEIGPDNGYVMPMPRPGEPVLGGHALVIRGYNDAMEPRGFFLVQNSWGDGWGENGCFFMPYEYIARTELSQPDMWMCHLGKPWRIA